MSSSAASTALDLEKGMVGTTEIGTLSKDSDGKTRRRIRLTPGYNPPEKTIYHYAPIFKMFERASLPLSFLFEPLTRLLP
jgi:hypothetical protein